MKTYYTYIYRRPGTDEPFYVGKGCSGRAYTHLRRKDKSYMANTIQKMINVGQRPEIEIIPALDEEHAYFLEECLIQAFGRKDLNKGPLLNHNDGGKGSPNPSPEVRAKMSASHLGVKKGPHTLTGKANISYAQRNSPIVAASRLHHSEVMTGRTTPESVRNKMSTSHKARPPFSEEHCANIKKSAQARGARQRAANAAAKEIK